jgi:hypothetical protein
MTVMGTRTRRFPSLDDRAVAALILGSAGLFIFNLVFAPFALVLGARAARDRSTGRFGRVGGRIAIALGVADLAVFAVLLLLSLHRGTLIG